MLKPLYIDIALYSLKAILHVILLTTPNNTRWEGVEP